jgi:hypothetical protein
MLFFHNTLMRTCAAFALRSSRNHINPCRPIGLCLARPIREHHLPSSSSSRTRLLSTFQPADPPGTHGTPVFSDIDFSVAAGPSSVATQRNSDPKSVFVVTGSNRGIGLQFVKSLIDRTEVGSREQKGAARTFLWTVRSTNFCVCVCRVS